MIAMEGKGVPTVSLTAEHFVKDARTSADILGLPELPLAVVSEPFTSHSADEIRDMVLQAVSQAEEGLTQQPQTVERTSQRPAERENIEAGNLLECLDRFNRLFVERGWSDGLPLVPPTPMAVEQMLSHSQLSPETVVVNGLYPGLGIATVEKLAINGVMAGCRPEHMPLLIGLARAYEGLGILGKTQAMSTGPNAPMVLVSGPMVKRLGFNYGTCVAGPGSPSHVNIVVGRALRLILMNIGQAYPGSMDMDTIGSPNKFSFCLAENGERSPWAPWNVEKGFDKETSTISITLVYPGPDVANFGGSTPEEMLDTLVTLTANYIGTGSVGRWLYGGRQDPVTKKILSERNVLLLAPAHADIMARHGWSRADVQEYVHQKSRMPFNQIGSHRWKNKTVHLKAARPELSWLLDQPDTRVSIAPGPECYEVFVTGGDSGRSQFYYGGSEVSTVAVDL